MIEHEYFKLFQKDSVDKQLILEFDNGITITNEDIFSESLNLDESLCSEDQLTFGCCEASVFKIQIANLMSSCKGLWFNVYIQLDGNDDKFPVGRYKVYSDELTADRLWRKITAYDKMYDIINIDVADWYNELLPDTSSTVTLKEFRDSFFNHFGIEQTYSIKPLYPSEDLYPDDLLYPANGGITENAYTNDDMIVEKTIDPSEISGKDVITAICQLKGCFGHITRDGKFKYIYLPQDFNGLFPSEELYPSDTLYPSDGSAYHKLNSSNYISATYEDYLCRTIDKIQIRKEEGDIGTIVGDGDNCYIIEDNFLVYGKNAEELEQIATNLLPVIENCVYRPFEATLPGNLCMEVGDTVKLYTKYQDVESYILKRTLKGIQALRDSVTTEGVEEYSEKVNSVNKSIIELKNKSNVLTRTVEETQGKITDLDTKVYKDISKLDEDTQADIKKAVEDMGVSVDEKLVSYSTTTEINSAITQKANEITTNVSETYSTKTETSEAIAGAVSTASEDATNKANNAVTSANNNTTELLKSYSTTTEINSAITQKANEITTNVSETYATQETVSKLSTTVQLTAEGLSSKVDANGIISAINQSSENVTIDASKINLAGSTLIQSKVSKGDLSSEISQESGSISIKSNRFSLTSDNTTISADGAIECKSFKMTGGSINIESNSSDSNLIKLSASTGNTTWITPGGFYTSYDGLTTSIIGGYISGSYTGSIRIGTGYFHDIYPYTSGGQISIGGGSLIIGSLGYSLGFFGGYGMGRQTVSKLATYTTQTVSTITTKVNEILSALANYGLIYSY
jgi:hypothetical protein